jgi:hypothetical protein
VGKQNRQILNSVARLSRIILGSTLLLSILWSNLPVGAAASGSECQLACCAGHAPHVAGACTHDSCEAFPTPQVHRARPTVQAEEFCGLSHRIQKAKIQIDFRPETSADHDRNKISVSTIAVTKPCQTDCGSGPSTFRNSNRRREIAALTYWHQPQPALTKRQSVSGYILSARNFEGNQLRLRGPPCLVVHPKQQTIFILS